MSSIPPGVSHYVVVDATDQAEPIAVFATYRDPGKALGFYRFDRPTKAWVDDPRMADYFIGRSADWVAKTMTLAIATMLLHGWGGVPYVHEGDTG
jgi:hypothetical protein